MLIAIIIGAVIGSFSHVVGAHQPVGRQWAFRRSQCDNCEHVLTVYELLPIVSYMWQRGRCRRCAVKIERSIVLVEWLGAMSAAILYNGYGFSWAFFLGVILLAFFCMISVADWYYMIVPNQFIGFIGVPIVLIVMFSSSFYEHFLGGILAFTMLYTLHLTTGGIGAGDVKLAFVLGSVVGVAHVFTMFLFASIFGFLFVLLMKKRKIPFAPSLCMATFLCYNINYFEMPWLM